eukprot:IDg4887t1
MPHAMNRETRRAATRDSRQLPSDALMRTGRAAAGEMRIRNAWKLRLRAKNTGRQPLKRKKAKPVILRQHCQ